MKGFCCRCSTIESLLPNQIQFYIFHNAVDWHIGVDSTPSLRDCHNFALFFVNRELTLLSKIKLSSFIWKGRNRVFNARFHHLCYIRKYTTQNVVAVSNVQSCCSRNCNKLGRKYHRKDGSFTSFIMAETALYNWEKANSLLR